MKNYMFRRFQPSLLRYHATAAFLIAANIGCDPIPDPPPIPEQPSDIHSTEAVASSSGVEILSPMVEGTHADHATTAILDTRDQIDSAPASQTPIWTVNGVSITEESVALVRKIQTDQILAQVPPEYQPEVLADLDANIRETMISLELLAKEAQAEGLDQDEETQAMMSFSQLESLAEAFFEDQIEASLAANDVEDWYQRHLVQFQRTEVDLRMLTVEDEALAASLKAQADAGADFEDLARANGTDPSAESGGDFLGENGPADLAELAPNIQEKLAPLSKGDTTEAFETMPGTFALLHLVSRKDTVQTLDTVQDEIEDRIRQEAASNLLHTVRDHGVIVPGEEGPPEGVSAPPEGQTVVFWVNGQAFDEVLISGILGPQIRSEEQRYQQQIMAQAQQLPEEARMAFAQQKMDEFTQQIPGIQQQMIESLVHQILLSQEAVKMGYATDQKVILKQQNRDREILANLYFRDRADKLAAEGGSPSPETMHGLVHDLWVAASILDTDGQPIPPPVREEVPQ